MFAYSLKTFFISDLHLSENHPEIADIFLKFLQDTIGVARELYILGDFFEAWIGDDDASEFNLKIIKALKAATELGLPIYFMHGNRDFLLGKKFFKATGCQLLAADENVIDLYGVPTLLLHGDTLCTLDLDYLKFRKRTRKWWVQKLFLLRPLKSRQAIAENMRKASLEYVSTTAEHIMDVTQSEVEKVMQKNNVAYLIHGHTHREAVHRFTLNGKDMTRIVLGAWHERGSVLICDDSGKRELVIV